MNSQENTLLDQNRKLDQIIQSLGEFRQEFVSFKQNVEARLASLENRMSSLENETKQGVEEMDRRILALEIQLSNVGSMVDKAISVSYESLSVVKGLRGEVMALRAESAYRNRELDRLNKIDQAA